MQKESGLKVGLFYHCSRDLVSELKDATDSRYSFIITPLCNPRADNFEPHCDLALSAYDWSKYIVGHVQQNDLEMINLNSICEIETQISYAHHLNIPALIFNCPSTFDGITRLSRVLNSKITASIGTTMPSLWVIIPLSSRSENSLYWRNDINCDDENGDCLNNEKEKSVDDPWKKWNHFRSLVSLDKRFGVALEMDGELPDEAFWKRWGGEPIKVLIISTNAFVTNRKGYPVLQRMQQNFIMFIIEKTAREVQFVVKGRNLHDDMSYYNQYIDHLKNNQAPMDSVSKFAVGYEDYLQIPLQPLMDNLESFTYEIFEKDPVKYDEYQKAIQEAMKTLNHIQNITVMVVGAGRGPLVEASLRAAGKLNRKILVYAVEKNKNAIITLKHLLKKNWGGTEGTDNGIVNVVCSDMREWNAPKKADIIVSELLGSFGDNELSPECLDGVWKYVQPHAISIPQTYSSFLAPIQSQKLYTETSLLRERDKPSIAPFESSYVVHMKNCYVIDSPLHVFTFDHYDLDKELSERDNKRYTCLSFTSSMDTICHGFAGYFNTTLYKDIKLSTLPQEHTIGMFSWFPIYFPLKEAVQIKKGDIIKVHFWRLSNSRSVWYEWCLTEPVPTPIHNPNGRSHSIGLF